MKTSVIVVILIVIIAAIGIYLATSEGSDVVITNFEECVAAGNLVMESYPRQCKAGVETFTEDIGDELQKSDLIRVSNPRPNQVISSPLEIKGEARGYWFFEASFPITLIDSDGNIVVQSYIMTADEWMTEEFVSFEKTLEFDIPQTLSTSTRGTLILHKDNPSGLPEYDDALEVPIYFEIERE